MTVAFHPDRPGSKPAGLCRAVLGLEPRAPHKRSLAPPVLRGGVVAEGGRRPSQPRGIGLLGVLRPPRRDVVLELVTLFAQRRQRPAAPRRPLVFGDAIGFLG